MTTEEKFNAAVNVIKGLPKNGSYQPSHDLMLRFYSFYKQATLGPCEGARPGFWDVVGRAKYDAWKSLGDMPSNEAMKRYVDELHSIVETMSYSDKVASFLNAPTGNISDLELVAGDIIQKVRSRSNSPKQSPPQANELNGRSDSYDEDSPYPSESDSDRTDDGDYVDTIEAPEPRRLIPNGHCAQPPPTTNGYAPVKSKKQSRTASIDVSQEVARTVQNLQSDVESLKVKVTVLESAEDNRKIRRRKKWWAEVNPRLMVFIVVWPLIVNLVLSRVFNRNRVS